jgi:hypothetical protein
LAASFQILTNMGLIDKTHLFFEQGKYGWQHAVYFMAG